MISSQVAPDAKELFRTLIFPNPLPGAVLSAPLGQATLGRAGAQAHPEEGFMGTP